MTAFVIVDIDVHDSFGYEEYKKLAQPLWSYTAANMSPAVARRKLRKAIGRRAAW